MYKIQKRKVILFIGILTIITACAVIIGWIFDLRWLQSIHPAYGSMKFNTALCFVLAGTLLILTQFQSKPGVKKIVWVLSLIILIIAALSLSEYAFHRNTGIDQLLMTDKAAIVTRDAFPGLMAASAAICFILTSLAFLGFSSNKPKLHLLGQYSLHVVGLISVAALIGYIHGLYSLYSLSYSTSMTFVTSVLFLLLSAAASLLHSSIGITGLFTGQLVGHSMARRAFIPLVLFVVIVDVLRPVVAVSPALFVVAIFSAGLFFTWYTARWLNRTDLKRSNAEEEIKAMNEELEERVADRSADLVSLLEKYRESELKFRSAFEHSAIGMAMVSLKGQWLKVNVRLCEMLGYTKKELRSMSFMDVTPAEDIDPNFNIIDYILNNEIEVHSIEKRYLRKDKSIIWVSVNISVIRDEAGKALYFVSQIIDITERKKAEDAQRLIVENEERLRALFDNVEGSTCLVDTHFKLIVFNQVFAETSRLLSGKDPQAGDEAYGFLPEDEKQKRYQVLKRVLTGQKEAIEVEYMRDGKMIYFRTTFTPVIVDGKVTAISSYSLNLTPVIETQNRLKESELKYSSLFEHASDAIYLLDMQGNFEEVNERLCGMTGYTRKELLKMNVADIIKPHQLAADPLALSFQSPEQNVLKERTFIRKDGSTFEVEANIKMFEQKQIMVISRDVTSRKMMEAKLTEAEVKFRTLAEKSKVGIYIYQDEKFTYVNPRFAEIFGYDPEELINSSANNTVIHEDYQKISGEYVRQRVDGERDSVHYEALGKNKDGTGRWVEFYGSTAMMGNKPTIIGTMIDVSERKLAEEFVLKEKALSDTVINSLPGIFYLRNLDGKFLRWNKNFETVTGYTTEEIEQLHCADLILDKDLDKIMSASENVLTQGYASVEARVLTKGGATISFLFSAAAIEYHGEQCILGTGFDISSRINAEKSLKKSEANLKTIMNTTDTAYVLLDKKLQIIAFNQMAVKFSNRQAPVTPTTGSHLADHLHTDGLKQFTIHADKVLGGETVNYEIKYRQADEANLWLDVRLFPIANDDGEIIGLMISLANITRRKMAELNVKEMYKSLAKQNEKLTDIAWIQSHVIRAPLARILGLVDMLKDIQDDNKEDRMQLLEFIFSSAEELDTATKDITALTQPVEKINKK